MKTNHEIKLTQAQWMIVRSRIAGEYPSSVLMIRPRMREVLGFTTRDQDNMIVLDFFDESKKSWFVLKYL